MSAPEDVCEAQCTKLCRDFANSIDARDYQKCIDLFAPDAVLDHVTGSFNGREGVTKMLTARPEDVVTRHVCTNIDIAVVDEKRATGKCYVILFRATAGGKEPPLPVPSPMLVEFHDEYSYVESKWLIKRRTTVLVFK